MRTYFIRRLLLMIPTLLGVSILVFSMVRFLPGDVIDQMMAEYRISVESEQELRAKLGLDRPLPVQYVSWMGDVLQGDLGASLRSDRGVLWELRQRLPATLQLGMMAILFSLTIALPIGVISALKQDTWIDYAARSFSIFALSAPSFWLGILVITFPAIWWQWSPPVGYRSLWDDPVKNLQMMILPAAILGLVTNGTVMRLTRAQMLEVMRQDYIRTAWAKGLRGRSVVIRHAMKNAFIPVVTVIGLQIPILVGGSVVMETIFSIPGTGTYLIQAIQNRDYPVIQGVNLLVATVVIFSNLLVDMSYGFLDPRVKYR
ncbi:MAG: ABC transporter permease [Dehalococcoidia bacterium]